MFFFFLVLHETRSELNILTPSSTYITGALQIGCACGNGDVVFSVTALAVVTCRTATVRGSAEDVFVCRQAALCDVALDSVVVVHFDGFELFTGAGGFLSGRNLSL